MRTCGDPAKRDEPFRIENQIQVSLSFILHPSPFILPFSTLPLYNINMVNDRSVMVPALFLEIVRNARSGDYGAASSLLNRSIPLMHTELASGNLSPTVLAEITSLLDTLLCAQKRSDWVGFADIVEYTLIDFWQAHFTPNY
jgi:hypothetical protein